MAASVRASEYQGWASVPWSLKEDAVGLADDTEAANQLANKLGLGSTAKANIATLMANLNLREKQVVLLYLPVGGSQQFYSAEPSINETNLVIKVIEVGPPEGAESATMGGRVLILTAPKKVQKIQITHEMLNFEEQPELKALVPVPELRSEKLWLETYEVAWKGHGEEHILAQDWFQKLNGEEQSEALQLVEKQRQFVAYKAAQWEAYWQVAERLLVKNFDEESDSGRIRQVINSIWRTVQQYLNG